MCGNIDPNNGPVFVGFLLQHGGVLPGGQEDIPVSATSGTLKFQCLVHPWMRTTVKLESKK